MWRIYFLILLFFSYHLSTHADQYSIFEHDQKKGLVDQNGKVLIPAVYDDLGWSESGNAVVKEIIGYKMGEFWGLVSIENIKITPPRYLDLYPVNEEYCIASKYDSYKLNSLCGLISISSGKTVIPFLFASLENAGHVFIASQINGTDLNYGIVDFKGKLITELKYMEIQSLSNDLFAVKESPELYHFIDSKGQFRNSLEIDQISQITSELFKISKQGQIGILSNTGQIITEPQYSEIKVSDNNEILGIPSKSWSILSFDNEIVSELVYDNLLPLESGIYKADRKNYTFIVRKNGDKLFKIKNADIHILNDTLSTIRPNHGYGVINNRGEIIYEPVFDSVRIHENRVFLFQKKGKKEGWMIGDLHGTLLSVKKYDQIFPLKNLFLAVKENDHWGITDKHGTELLQPIFDTLLSVNSNKFLVKFHRETGVMDIYGEWKSYPRAGDLYILENDHYLISSYQESVVFDFTGNLKFTCNDYLKPIDGGFLVENYKHRFGLIDQSYHELLPVEYSEIKPLIKDSLYIFRNETGYGTVDLKGQILFKDDTRFQEILGYSEDYIGVKINGEYGFVDGMGRLRIANRYQGIQLFNEGLAHVKILGKWGSVDKRENLVIQPYYDEIEPFLNGLAIATRDNKFGIIDNTGNTRIGFEYDSIGRLKEGGFICYLKGEAGLIDQEGKLKFYPKFDYIKDLQNGFVIVQRNGRFGVLSESGIIKIPFIHDEIIFDPINNVILVSSKKKLQSIWLDNGL